MADSAPLPAGSTIGILGGGQLGRMLAMAAVQLGYRNELMAIDDPEERADEFNKRVDRAYEAAKAVNAAAGGGLDDVIDPAETRSWIAESLKRVPPPPPRTEKKYPYIDTW